MKLTHEFVALVPDQLETGVVYVCIRYKTVSHLCACGCGREVVTPLSPAGWTLSFDGDSISLSPSIGNWRFPCQAHYWIKKDQVQWAKKFTPEQIGEVEFEDLEATRQRFERPTDDETSRPAAARPGSPVKSRWNQFKERWFQWKKRTR